MVDRADLVRSFSSGGGSLLDHYILGMFSRDTHKSFNCSMFNVATSHQNSSCVLVLLNVRGCFGVTEEDILSFYGVFFF